MNLRHNSNDKQQQPCVEFDDIHKLITKQLSLKTDINNIELELDDKIKEYVFENNTIIRMKCHDTHGTRNEVIVITNTVNNASVEVMSYYKEGNTIRCHSCVEIKSYIFHNYVGLCKDMSFNEFMCMLNAYLTTYEDNND